MNTREFVREPRTAPWPGFTRESASRGGAVTRRTGATGGEGIGAVPSGPYLRDGGAAGVAGPPGRTGAHGDGRRGCR